MKEKNRRLAAVALSAAVLSFGAAAEANMVKKLGVLLQIEKAAKTLYPESIPVTVKLEKGSGRETVNTFLTRGGASEVPGTEMRSLSIDFPRYVPLDSISSIEIFTRPGSSGSPATSPNPTEIRVRQLCVIPGFVEYAGSENLAHLFYYINDAFRAAPSLPSYLRDTLGLPELVTNKGSGSFSQSAALRISLARADRQGDVTSQLSFRTNFSDTTRKDSNFALLAETWDGRLFQVECSPMVERERTALVDLSSPLGLRDLKALHGLFARRGITTGNPLPAKGALDGGDGVSWASIVTSSAPRATVGMWRGVRQENWTSETHLNPTNRDGRPGYMRSPMKQLDHFLVWLETGDKGLDPRITPELEITVKSGKVYRIPFTRPAGRESLPFFPRADPQGVIPMVLDLTEDVSWVDLGVRPVDSSRSTALSKVDEPTTRLAHGIPVHAISKVGISLRWTGPRPTGLVNTEWDVKNIIIAAGRRSIFDLRPDDSWTPLFIKMGWNKTFRYVVNSPTYIPTTLKFEERVDIAPIAYKVGVSGGVAPRIAR